MDSLRISSQFDRKAASLVLRKMVNWLYGASRRVDAEHSRACAMTPSVQKMQRTSINSRNRSSPHHLPWHCPPGGVYFTGREETTREKVAAYNAAYYKANREKVLVRMAAYYEAKKQEKIEIEWQERAEGDG